MVHVPSLEQMNWLLEHLDAYICILMNSPYPFNALRSIYINSGHVKYVN